jgi:hypothetical protein
MEAVKVKARIDEERRLIWLEPVPLRPGEVEVIVLYPEPGAAPKSPSEWPVLDGGRYLGGKLRREDIYDDER